MYSRFWLLFVLLAIAGCVAKVPAPVIDKSRQSDYAYVENETGCQAKAVGEFCHVVERGDTLYAISRRYGLKVVEIASRNVIKAPYIIRPGDFLVVRQGGESIGVAEPLATSRETRSVEAPSTPTTRDTATATTPTSSTSPVRSTVDNTPSTPTPPPSSTSSRPSASVATAPPVKMTLRTTRTKSGWQWPVPYEPVANDGGKGLEYLLGDDTEIVAATGGKVIYAGAGLNKFRHLIIVDSATSHLVAYEFNTSHGITEGQTIDRGDTITRIIRQSEDGSLDAERYRQFRFEIWANGKPLNPDSVIAVVTRN